MFNIILYLCQKFVIRQIIWRSTVDKSFHNSTYLLNDKFRPWDIKGINQLSFTCMFMNHSRTQGKGCDRTKSVSVPQWVIIDHSNVVLHLSALPFTLCRSSFHTQNLSYTPKNEEMLYMLLYIGVAKNIKKHANVPPISKCNGNPGYDLLCSPNQLYCFWWRSHRRQRCSSS